MRHGWFWMIPLPDEVMSVGVVGTRAFFKANGGNIDARSPKPWRQRRALPRTWPRPSRSARSPPAPTARLDSQSYVGENHILVGDAAAFIDPLFSSGVMMAMSSAAFAATAVDGLLEGRRPRERIVREYERKIRRSLTSLSWLIYRINAPILRDLLVSSFDPSIRGTN